MSLNVKLQVVILADVGSSPIVHPNFNAAKFDWGQIFRRIYRRHHLYVMHVKIPPYALALCTGRACAVP